LNRPDGWGDYSFISEPFTTDEGEEMVLLVIPNKLWDDIIEETPNVTLSLFTAENVLGEHPAIGQRVTGFGEDGEITFNPLFAPTGNNNINIRSPRHLVNIGKVETDGVTFNQQLHIDFAVYYHGTGVTDHYRTFTNRAAVTGTFKGLYNGAPVNTGTAIVPRLIAGLNINASGIDNIGLFSINEGTVQNVTLRDPVIRGRNNVGAIAGQNLGTIQRISVQQTADSRPINSFCKSSGYG
jgi:hypothetical protein